MQNIDRPESKPPLRRDRRVKYDPDFIKEQQDSLPVRLGARRSFLKDINGGQAMAAATGSIRELAKLMKEAISPDDSSDEMLELPRELLLNIENRSSGRVGFITAAPYRPKPGDV